ncbi:tRNA methyltransferase 10 homolog C-like [Brevipalpus obovatus]|uniref:tRNA methyltransferase 10 homolog C-like n=1 Tax=Brevipalpus obovatus TaxID=246614 RepID=UPI003D9E34AA
MTISRGLLSLAIIRHRSSSYNQLDVTEIVADFVYRRKKFCNLELSNYSDIIKSSEESSIVEYILREWENIKVNTGLVPSNISRKDMRQLIHCLNKNLDVSEKFLDLLETEVMLKFNVNKKKKQYYEAHWTAPGDPNTLFDENGSPNYSKEAQSFFIPFNIRNMNQMASLPKLFEISQENEFCQKLIIDCDNYHNDILAAKVVSRDIVNAFWYNAYNVDPFDIHVCGVKKGSAFDAALKLCQKTDFIRGSHPLSSNIHSGPLWRYCPHDKIIYVSPHGGKEIVSFNPKATYVISSYIAGRDTRERFLEKIQRTKWESVRLPKLPSLLPHQFHLVAVIGIISALKQGSSIENAMRKFLKARRPRLTESDESKDRVVSAKIQMR